MTSNFRNMLFTGTLAAAFACLASGQSSTHIQTARSAIASAVWSGNSLYISGTNATPIKRGDRAKGVAAEYGDTKQQTQSALSKIESTLKEQGLTMGDVVFMHVYLVGDPAKGNKMDFAGMNDAFKTFFGTEGQPNKPARTTVQVAALVSSGALVEIDAVAEKSAK